MFGYRHVMVAVDNSPHSNRAIELALAVARAFGARLTGAHAYAAALHDTRFRQMEGGLPDKYRAEVELERQREVHDSLITRGLQVITDSYLDVVDARAADYGVAPARKSLEGKNYRALVDDAAASDYDLIAIGALGLGAVKDSVIGSVCERVVRGVDRDVLVARDPARSFDGGPIMVAVDGSPCSFAGVRIGVELARALGAPLEIVSAFDPYFHYVAFNSIAGVLSDEAGRVFRFKEQEQLHEDIIDSGLAKIYRAHLAVADKLAREHGATAGTELVAGKPFRAILDRVRARRASLLIVGRRGVHADDGLDLGSTAENLVRLAPCHVLVTARSFQPAVEDIAAETTAWTDEAEQRVERVPSFARGMARGAILRYAHERGHTVITSAIVDAATASLLPASAMAAMGMIEQAGRARSAEPAWTDDARRALDAITDPSAREHTRLRAEKRARVERVAEIPAAFVSALSWSAEAEARLAKVPAGFVRDMTRQRLEAFARRHGTDEVTVELMDRKYAEWSEGSARVEPTLPWHDDAVARIERVPDLVRGMVVKEVERCAVAMGRDVVTGDVMDNAMGAWAQRGSFHSEHEPDQYD